MPEKKKQSSLRRHAKRAARDYNLSVRYPHLYAQAAKQPIDPCKVLFIEGKTNKRPDSFVVMMDYLLAHYDYQVEFVALNQANTGFRAYSRKCEELIPKLATAHYVFLSDANELVSCVEIRSETKVVQLWHACGAFKKWGMSTADLKFGGNRKELERHPFYRNLDLVTVSSPEVEWAYREAMDLASAPEIVRPTGVSHTDVYFDPVFVQGAKLDVAAEFPASASKKVLLYAPTFRGHVRSAAAPDALDIEMLQRRFGDEYVLLVKHHPFVKEYPPIPDAAKNFAFYAKETPIERLLFAADVLITDYSSVVFEYSLMGKPVVFFAYDREDYGDWRGFYYDYEALTPGPVVSSNDELAECLARIEETFDHEALAAFREKFMRSCDGGSTKRICDIVLEDAAAHVLPPLGERMIQRNGEDGIDISIVVPAYNAEDTLPRAVDSVLAQTYPSGRMELIVVDDGSSDGTWDVLCRYAAEYPGVVKPYRLDAPSGSPSAPRNLGLSKAVGEYVFFLDADDWLGEEAISRMLEHAVDWGSDVLYVKIRGEGGRRVPLSMFRYNEASVDKYRSKVMWSFGPYKLYRRETIKDIRFPEYMPEDIGFVLRALVKAEIVSVASDYAYYHLTCDSQSGNISYSTWDDVEQNLKAYADIFGFIQGNVPESERDRVLMRRLFNRDIAETLITIATEDDNQAQGHLERLRNLITPLYSESLCNVLAVEKRPLIEAALNEKTDLTSIRAIAIETPSVRKHVPANTTA